MSGPRRADWPDVRTDGARWLAELLIDMEDEVGEIARLRLIEQLHPLVG
jgi:hypothetical protein